MLYKGQESLLWGYGKQKFGYPRKFLIYKIG